MVKGMMELYFVTGRRTKWIEETSSNLEGVEQSGLRKRDGEA
ncbi:uncharacterized protein G2W53_018078 [Senna tora]|uniref:Uncharacterized protein n=1 Tax=Senna tora TaxID=362788 RepID=A0A834TSE0_9FABA|nr:uncharacterized protein G2W53_018078 [Senna tora]